MTIMQYSRNKSVISFSNIFVSMNFLLRLAIYTLSVLITAYLLPGIYVESFFTAVVVAVVLGVLNVIVKPVLILFSLPVVIFSFGLFLIVINTLIILLTDKLVDGFEVHGFWNALLFSIVLWMVTGILNAIKERDEQTV
jgi:putative membrane protein